MRSAWLLVRKNFFMPFLGAVVMGSLLLLRSFVRSLVFSGGLPLKVSAENFSQNCRLSSSRGNGMASRP